MSKILIMRVIQAQMKCRVLIQQQLRLQKCQRSIVIAFHLYYKNETQTMPKNCMEIGSWCEYCGKRVLSARKKLSVFLSQPKKKLEQSFVSALIIIVKLFLFTFILCNHMSFLYRLRLYFDNLPSMSLEVWQDGVSCKCLWLTGHHQQAILEDMRRSSWKGCWYQLELLALLCFLLVSSAGCMGKKKTWKLLHCCTIIAHWPLFTQL